MAYTRSARAVIALAVTYKRWEGRDGPAAAAMRRLIRLRHRFWSMVTGSDLLLGVTVARDLKLPHPNGVVIHEDAVIGTGCMIMQQVTIGMIDGPAPRLGNDVYVGAGARILGGVTVGDGARIGANAVVLRDVPAGATAVGVPARILSRA